MVVVVVFVSNFLYIVIGIFLERNFDIVLPRLKEQTEKKNADGWGGGGGCNSAGKEREHGTALCLRTRESKPSPMLR